MSAAPGENAELVRGLYEIFNRGGDGREFVTPDVEYVNPDYAIEAGTRRGPEEWGKAIRNLRERWGEAEIEVERISESGDQVVAVVSLHVSGRGSGVANIVPQSHLWTIQDGKVASFGWWNDREAAARALEEAGEDT